MGCANCGASLEGRRSDARFCSDSCRFAAWIGNHPEVREQRLATAQKANQRASRNRTRRHDLHDRRVRVSILPEDDSLTILAKVEAARRLAELEAKGAK
jgi:hypothetical protein